MQNLDVLPDIEEEISEFDGHAHYVRVDVLVQGGVQTALCGKRWIPSKIADALDLPVCVKCANLMEILRMLDNS